MPSKRTYHNRENPVDRWFQFSRLSGGLAMPWDITLIVFLLAVILPWRGLLPIMPAGSQHRPGSIRSLLCTIHSHDSHARF